MVDALPSKRHTIGLRITVRRPSEFYSWGSEAFLTF